MSRCGGSSKDPYYKFSSSMASALVKSRVVKRQSEGLCRIQRVPAFYVLSFVHAQNGEFNKNNNRVV